MNASTQGRANRRRGVEWERALVRYLTAAGLPVDRTPTGRHDDAGDLDGIPWLLIEAKNHARHELGPWLDRAETKARRTGRRAALVVKRRQRPTGEAFVVMRLDAFAELLVDGELAHPIEVDETPEPRPVVR